MWRFPITSKPVILISSVTSVTSAMYLIRDYMKGARFTKDVNCEGKVAIVTGGNSGIGKETARELARRGATVFILCRDMKRCHKARREIVHTTKNKYVYARECDLGCLDSVQKFAKEFIKNEQKLDILINNAAIYCVPYGRTKEHFESHLGVNHMGHFLLTNLLMDLLVKSAPSRIVNVTISPKYSSEIKVADLNSDKSYKPIEAYKQSKLANILFTKELAERLKGTGVTANSVYPGASYTNLYKLKDNNITGRIGQAFAYAFMWVLFKPPTCAAQTVLHAALDPSLENVSGKYFEECEEKELPSHADDPTIARWLWIVSEKWTRLKQFKDNLLSDEEPSHDVSDVGTVVFS